MSPLLFLAAVSLTAIVIFFFQSIAFLIAAALKRNDVADVAWGLLFIVATYAMMIATHSFQFRSLLIAGLVTLWGLRLSAHIFFRMRGKAEDFRYQQWRKEWGRWWMVRSYLQVFLLQGVFALLILFPVLMGIESSEIQLPSLIPLGVAVWVIGFFFEAVGDYQLTQFLRSRTKPHAIMQTGLWSLTRHPNYFGEVSQWWGIWLIACTAPYGWMTIIGPITITILIIGISGIPMLEKKYIGNKEFEAYKKKTNAFFPWLPKKA